VSFLLVYVREAHPSNGWVLEENVEVGIDVADPVTAEERVTVARSCCANLRVDLPTAVDEPDDAVASAYGGWPDRLYLVDADGRVAFQGGEGPFGFEPDALAAAIEAAVR
jgi:hypothetical protein